VAAVNPFRDRRVRLAVRQAIDVAAINREVMGGLAEPATQFAAPRVFGFSPRIVAPAFDPERARALLTAAGYRAGFSVVLDAPSGLYPMDAAIAGRVAAALLPLGIRVRVELLDKQALFDKLGRRESSFYMLSWNCLTADMQEILDYLLHSPDPAHGYGGENAGGYSNPELDRLGEQAARTMNPVERGALLAQAVELAHQDTPWVPVYVQSIVYGLRTPFQWRPRPDKRIRVSDVTLAD
jgi:peptide/nickel transport system substrate-binding protein